MAKNFEELVYLSYREKDVDMSLITEIKKKLETQGLPYVEEHVYDFMMQGAIECDNIDKALDMLDNYKFVDGHIWNIKENCTVESMYVEPPYDPTYDYADDTDYGDEDQNDLMDLIDNYAPQDTNMDDSEAAPFEVIE